MDTSATINVPAPLTRGFETLTTLRHTDILNFIFFQVLDSEARTTILETMYTNAKDSGKPAETLRNIQAFKMAHNLDNRFFDLGVSNQILATEYMKLARYITLHDKSPDYCLHLLSVAAVIEDHQTLKKITQEISARSGNISQGIITKPESTSRFQGRNQNKEIPSFFSAENVGYTFELLKYLLENFDRYSEEMQTGIVGFTYMIVNMLSSAHASLFKSSGSLNSETVEDIARLMDSNTQFIQSYGKEFKEKMQLYYPGIYKV